MGVELVIAAIAVVGSAVAQTQARKDRKRASEIARRREALKTRRAQIENIEAFRQSVGQVTNIAAQTGAAGSSGVLGVQSSLTSQASSNVAFNEQLLQFAESQAKFLDKAATHDITAGVFSSVASISASAAG